MATTHSNIGLAPPFEAYRGGEPYIFVSYAHSDTAQVYPELDRLHRLGFRVWYDEGISPGHDWPQELASAIESSALFLLFVSPRSVASDNCNREITFALAKERPLLAVHLDDTTLPSGLELSIGNSQAILKHRMRPDSYERKLTEALTSILGLPGEEPPLPTTIEGVQKPGRKTWAGVVAIILVAAAFGGYRYWSSASTERWITDVAVPEIERAVETDRFLDAFIQVQEIERAAPEHALLANLWPRVSVSGTVLSEPAGAVLSVRRLGDDETKWLRLGATPLEGAPLPIGNYVWQLDAGEDGVRVFFRNHASAWFGVIPGTTPPVIELGHQFESTQHIPESSVIAVATNFIFPDAVTVPEFHIETNEVTNAEYQMFVEAGGYQKRDYWDGLGLLDGDGGMSWEAAQALLVDATGRPGPSTWELGTYPRGKAAYPVSGVSWFEATAYARFRDMQLPTLRHWMAAAMPIYATSLGPISNIGGSSGILPAASPTIDPNGTRHIFGNVREWLHNASADHRWIMGGSWRDPAYMAAHRNTLPPLDRSAANGVRLATFPTEFPEAWLEPVPIPITDYRGAEPVSDEAFAIIREQFVDVGAELAPQVEHPSTQADNWAYERVSIASDRADDRIIINLYLPKTATTPVQAVILFPGIGDFLGLASSELTPAI